jgi:hypothetical protein
MAEPSVQHLFRQWRGGDAEAGKVMAQKFSDWYYAVTTVRVADGSGREPLERACQGFAQGIVTVTRPSALVDWAHGLLEVQLQSIGRGLEAGPCSGGDYPNALTKKQSPTQLIQASAQSMDPAQLRLLAHAFDGATPIETLEQIGDEMGGLPFAMLDARYALKRKIHSSAEIPFAVVPNESDMDRAPISLYEAGRLASADEVCSLEKWLLSDIDLCKDIAEFSAFVHALRGGALSAHLSTQPAPAPVAAPVAAPVPAPRPMQAPAPEKEPDEMLDLSEVESYEGPGEEDALDQSSDVGLDTPPASAPSSARDQESALQEAPTSAMRSIMTIAAFVLLGTALLFAGMVWMLRG